MSIVIGLGNPGRAYELTRHNLGFRIIDEIAQKCNSSFQPGKGEFWSCTCSFKNLELSLLKPTTYMNNSGVAVLEFIEQYNISIKDLLVVCDDFQLPLGFLRFRSQGSDGGHHGLESIIYHLGSDEFSRLRCGIGSEFMPTDRTLMAQYVLQTFEKEENNRVESMVKSAVDAVLCFAEYGIENAMNTYNNRNS